MDGDRTGTLRGRGRGRLNYEKYRANLEKRVKEQEGVLSENRYTEYARAVLACKAIGIDPSDIGGYDLGKLLEDFETVTAQGLNGAVYAFLP